MTKVCKTAHCLVCLLGMWGLLDPGVLAGRARHNFSGELKGDGTQLDAPAVVSADVCRRGALPCCPVRAPQGGSSHTWTALCAVAPRQGLWLAQHRRYEYDPGLLQYMGICTAQEGSASPPLFQAKPRMNHQTKA